MDLLLLLRDPGIDDAGDREVNGLGGLFVGGMLGYENEHAFLTVAGFRQDLEHRFAVLILSSRTLVFLPKGLFGRF